MQELRALETVKDQLKNICQLEHTRHRSLTNFVINLPAALIAYTYQEKKPVLKLNLNRNTEHSYTLHNSPSGVSF